MKQALSILLAAALLYTTVGCGSTSPSSPAPPASPSVSAPSQTTPLPQETAKPDAEQAEKDLLAILNDPAAPVSGLSVLAIQNGEVIFQKCAGNRLIDPVDPSKNLPIDPDTRYRIASISKVFTAIAVMQMVEQGKINLDADISDYLGFSLRNPNYPDTAITCRMLMSHTSSIRDGSVYSIPPEYSIRTLFEPDGTYWLDGEHFANSADGSDRSPGGYFSYTNLNYGVLGTILEKISGERFDVYMKKNVLEPMGLKASYNPGDFDEATIAALSPLYQKQQNEVWDKNGPYIAQIDDYQGKTQPHDQVLVTNPDLGGEEVVLADLSKYEIGTNGTLFSPQGGLRISTAELEVMMKMFLNDGKIGDRVILKPESVDIMFTPGWTYDEQKKNGDTYDGLMTCYGPGIQTMTSKYLDRFVEGRDIVLSGHFGEAYGLLAGFFLDREAKNGILYLMNGMGAPESENYGTYSGMYRWEEKFCTALLDNLFPAMGTPAAS